MRILPAKGALGPWLFETRFWPEDVDCGYNWSYRHKYANTALVSYELVSSNQFIFLHFMLSFQATCSTLLYLQQILISTIQFLFKMPWKMVGCQINVYLIILNQCGIFFRMWIPLHRLSWNAVTISSVINFVNYSVRSMSNRFNWFRVALTNTIQCELKASIFRSALDLVTCSLITSTSKRLFTPVLICPCLALSGDSRQVIISLERLSRSKPIWLIVSISHL